AASPPVVYATTQVSLAQHLAEVGLENGRWLFELIREPGQGLEFAHGLFRLPHALSGRVHLAAEEVGILPVDGHFGKRLDFSLDAIELDRHEVRVLPGAAVVVETQLRHRDAVLQRANDAL